MRAAVLHGAGDPPLITVDEVADPRVGPHDVLIKVEACGLCGHDQADALGLATIALPAVLGHEIAGTITAVGADVRSLSVGDRVATRMFQTCGHCDICLSGTDLRCPERAFMYGGFADLVVCGERSVVPIPDGVDSASAAIVGCAIGTVLQAIQHVGRVIEGESVLVTGATGGLGLHAVQVVRALGAHPVALTGSMAQADLLASLGAEHVVDSRADGAWSDILDATNGRGADVVIDNVGTGAVFNTGFRGLAHGGRYVFTGQVSREKIGFYPKFLFSKEATITGSAGVLLGTMRDAMAMVQRNDVRAITTSLPLANVEAAFQSLANREVVGRLVLQPGSDPVTA